MFISDEDPEQALDDSTFKSVWEVLKALRAHDEKLGEELDELRRNLGARVAPPRRPGKIKLDLPAALVGASFAERALWCGQRRPGSSGTACCNGSPRARDTHRFRGSLERTAIGSAGGWVGDQRKRYNQGLLPDERIRRLEEVNGWTWDALEDSWEASFARLQSYSKRTGDSGVRPSTMTPTATGSASGSRPKDASTAAASWRKSVTQGSLACRTGAGIHTARLGSEATRD